MVPTLLFIFILSLCSCIFHFYVGVYCFYSCRWRSSIFFLLVFFGPNGSVIAFHDSRTEKSWGFLCARWFLIPYRDWNVFLYFSCCFCIFFIGVCPFEVCLGNDEITMNKSKWLSIGTVVGCMWWRCQSTVQPLPKWIMTTRQWWVFVGRLYGRMSTRCNVDGCWYYSKYTFDVITGSSCFELKGFQWCDGGSSAFLHGLRDFVGQIFDYWLWVLFGLILGSVSTLLFRFVICLFWTLRV